jgi:hypothetical protein
MMPPLAKSAVARKDVGTLEATGGGRECERDMSSTAMDTLQLPTSRSFLGPHAQTSTSQASDWMVALLFLQLLCAT